MSMPTPPTSTTTRSQADLRHRSPHGGDHRRSRLAGERRRAGPAPPTPDVADRQRQRVGRIGRPGASVEPEQAGDHRGDLGLVGAAAAGDGGLDLGRGMQGDGDAARRGARASRPPAACAVPMTVRDVDVGEDPLDGHDVGREPRRATRRARARGRPAAPPGRRRVGVRTTPTATIAAARPAAPSTTPRPHRVRPGSTPSTRTCALFRG